ncbi:MAG: CDP-diacylglycerol--glycerol-3-phosphate 3-phosphatidyltransferase, partial [Leucobacter sp.]
VVAAAWMGKLKTVAQSVAITLALLPLASVLGAAAPVALWANGVTMTIAVALTLLSGIDYVIAFARNRGTAR